MVVGTVRGMVISPRSNCSIGLSVDVFWYACPNLGSLDGHIDALPTSVRSMLDGYPGSQQAPCTTVAMAAGHRST